MRELVDDPRVLEAALALVDDYYASGKKGDTTSGTSRLEGSISDGLRNQELTRLRLTIRELLLDSVGERRRERDHEGGCRDERRQDEEAGAVRRQARRVLKAVRLYNQRLRAAHRSTFRIGDSISVRAVDDQRIVDSMRCRLDKLTRIARANCSSSLPTPVVSDKPTVAANSMKDQCKYGYYLPFKLSIVADAIWESMLSMDYGRCHEVDELFTQGQDEIMGMVSSSSHTIAGAFAMTGPTAVRRIYEDDGSVLFVYASIGSGSATSIASPRSFNAPNLLAGCVFKEAGWTRLSRVPQSSGGTRPKVLMELAQSFVVEALPGYSVPKRQLVGFWDATLEHAMQEPRSRNSLENRLMDLSMRSGTSSP